MAARVTVEDLKGVLFAIDMASSLLESGVEDPDTIEQINRAARCYDWVLAEIRRRERRQIVRDAVAHANTYLKDREAQVSK